MPSFFVVHTQPNCEQRAHDHLRSQQCDVYYPQILVATRHARRVIQSPRPFLPRYMFVADDGRGVSFIKRSYGVSDVVRNGLEPARVSQRDVNRILAREDDDGFVRLDGIMADNALAKVFRQGERLRVNEAQFGTPIDAIFRQMRGETRALVFLCILGQQVAAELSVGVLERAA